MIRMARFGRTSRLLALLVLASVLLLRGDAAPVRLSAQTDATHLATAQATYNLLLDHFYRVPDPVALLSDAWDGATRALVVAGLPGPRPAPPEMPADRAGAWQAFASAYRDLIARAPAPLSATEIAFAAADQMAAGLHEGHTAFLTPDDYQGFIDQLSGENARVGLGIELATSVPWIISDVAPDSPAEHAGVQIGDVIVAVDGQDVTAIARPALNSLLRRNEGDSISLGVTRQDGGRLTLTVTIGTYTFPDLESRVLPNGVGYLRLRSFSSFIHTPGGPPTAIEALDRALESFERAGVSVWVMDLRGNPGGFGFTADELLGRFLPGAISARLRDERGHEGQDISAGRPFRVQHPMAVLIDGDSASSSEIFASAMQEYGRATLVGTRSAGILASAFLFPVPDGAALYLAMGSVHTGRTDTVVDGVGVTPDVEVDDTRMDGTDSQLDAAIAAARSMAAPDVTAPPVPAMSADAIRSLVSGYLPEGNAAPSTPLIASPRLLGDLTLTDPSEYVALLGPARDGLALARTVRERGWQGSYSRFYGEAPGLGGPYLGVIVDVYAGQAGALAALNSNDASDVQQPVPATIQLGDGAVAYRGEWEGAGVTALVWRTGRLVVTALYSGVPGQESFDPVIALARQVDARIRARPLPGGTATPAATVTPAATATPVPTVTRTTTPPAQTPTPAAPPTAMPTPIVVPRQEG
jgi:carboxyl-terminal processing protease